MIRMMLVAAVAVAAAAFLLPETLAMLPDLPEAAGAADRITAARQGALDALYSAAGGITGEITGAIASAGSASEGMLDAAEEMRDAASEAVAQIAWRDDAASDR